ncbi:hypothetical protein KFE25_008804 [Diacronema lutheri]|uniref:YchJ-like middle NTF2-like domain-containing protein n=1 Tax=Diacronema lutheri TaxID=2081491 RepID=A0A8J5XRI4_DIALT|nr:hypothetical protein KFE25_008804 [Diacronema lutheri]|mmetsp:Transcript_10447/g.32941  ORF Transcript_10447/g.32941 Transcript_10447/m.32941 type:complete len:223 (-) Transcript_10447:90-758(-)
MASLGRALFLLLWLLHADGLVTMMAAGRRGGKAGGTSGKGFGSKPPSLGDVIRATKTRAPADAASTPCACGSGAAYAACCQPYHDGEAVATTAERLVRTRYTAFCYRLPAYIVSTTHPTNRDFNPNAVDAVRALDRRGMFDSFEFVGLEIGSVEEQSSEERFVAFTVTLRALESDGGIAKGSELRVSERSRFLPRSDVAGWLYASGEVRAQVEGLEDALLNG